MSLSVIKVNRKNYKEILKLKVSKGQENFIESVKVCLKEAREDSVWKTVGIYNGDKAVGFAMYGLFLNEGKNGKVWLDRFLISSQYQGMGYGKEGINILIKHLYEEFGYKKIYLSVYDNNIKAIDLYKKIGFEFNGELDINGEKVMVINLSHMEEQNV